MRTSRSTSSMRSRPVPAVDRALRILQTLASGSLRLVEIARTLRLPKSTTLAILRTLQLHRIVAYDADTGRYRLGAGLVSLSGAAQAHGDLRRVARPVLERLVRLTGETVVLHLPDAEGSVIVDREESPHQLRVAAPLGHRLPPFAGAVAKAIFAGLPEREAARQLARKRLPQFTPRSITSRAAYVRELRQVRRQGYATDDEEYLPGVRAVSAPVVGASNQVLAILSVVGVKTRLTDPTMAQMARQVRDSVEEISVALGRSAPVRASPDGAHGVPAAGLRSRQRETRP